MIAKWFNWLFGKKASTTIAGLIAGAASGAATSASMGNMSKEQLIAGAVTGAVAALTGVAGRSHGEG